MEEKKKLCMFLLGKILHKSVFSAVDFFFHFLTLAYPLLYPAISLLAFMLLNFERAFWRTWRIAVLPFPVAVALPLIFFLSVGSFCAQNTLKNVVRLLS